MKIMFCCCDKEVCIQIGELILQPKDKATENKLRWWLLDMTNEVIGDILKPFEKVKNKSECLREAHANLRKLKEDLEALQRSVERKIEN